jgi:hypothetical protein
MIISKKIWNLDRDHPVRSLLRWGIYVLLIVGVVALIVHTFPLIFEWLQGRFFKDADAKTGEVFDGVSAFFSAVAFGLLILTVLLQAHELSLQRRELQDTRMVLKQQADTLELQQFDSTFFNLLSLHNEIVRSLVLINQPPRSHISQGLTIEVSSREPIRYEGHEVPPVLVGLLLDKLHDAKYKHPEGSYTDLYTEAYRLLFLAHRDLLGHYFRNLYHVVKFVDRSKIKEKKRYTNFLRAQLSGSESELLFFNCKSEWGTGFLELAIRYSLLEHLPLGDHFPPELLLTYPREAYGNSVFLLGYYDHLSGDRDQHATQAGEAKPSVSGDSG